ncbi:putative PurR-regulated permease PerM [Actinoalloteichus hoggarensis]|uniref:AI-2 transport protein TqsA n=1 Tax=Actinoalloteichus hoggarensis TaxID=1470176 RepID=A0A221W7F9_9PSEU|nr:AI-2E family transporter [Actinoalloteichus hoggarensis]ASO21892.1 AI-2 transport protein TqsA [Actinoalloteichus hoggarensis]MBB5922489.1 putative PurR-regulated permease PerM [Actinoalloteichus hoggarensis]
MTTADRRDDSETDARRALPRWLRVSAAAGWRLLVLVAALYVLGVVATRISIVLIPLAIALLLAALLEPAMSALRRRGMSRGPATAIVLVSGVAGLGTALTFIVATFVGGLADLQSSLIQGLNSIRAWLTDGPLGLESAQIDNAIGELGTTLQDNQQRVFSGALTTVTTVGGFVTGLVLVIFILVFLLRDGPLIWRFVLRAVPRSRRALADEAGRNAFRSLTGYIRATATVAVIDAVGIGIGLVILGIPLALPLTALVFFGAFIPLIGALVSGAAAILVALASQGLVAALLVLGIVLLVQQIEGNVLHPWIMGRTMRLHPLAVALTLTIGLSQAGIIGGLLAVPLLTSLRAMARTWRGTRDDDPDDPVGEVEANPASRSRTRAGTAGDRGSVDDGEEPESSPT